MTISPAKPTTRIKELIEKPLTDNQYQVAAKVVAYSNRLEEKELAPKSELTIRFRTSGDSRVQPFSFSSGVNSDGAMSRSSVGMPAFAR